MIHDQDLLARLEAFAPESFDGEVFRATRPGLDPLTASVAGGRWSQKDDAPTLYTSLDRDGAIAEMAFHLSQLTPVPRKPILLNRLAVATSKTLRLLRTDLIELGVDWERFAEVDYGRAREIGAAVAFLECDGLLAPSARWDCENLILFPLNHRFEDKFELVKTQEVNWIDWAEEHGLRGL